ncbi:MAG: redoxin domain-containing protein [Candidatus Latescibacteria bacterium]|nr:redoxin domain-containing protein [Candidatus Latescibacterota bacterium]
MQDYAAKNVQILGVSTDDTEANAQFAAAQSFPYPLLCDTERAVCLAYGACQSASDGAASRHTFVIGPDGLIAQIHTKVDARSQPETLLATL